MIARHATKPRSVTLRGRELSVCSYGDCMSNCVWDTQSCWEHMTTSEHADIRHRLVDCLRSGQQLRKIVLTGCDLSGFDFAGADMEGAILNGADLRRCVFTEANLRRVFFGGADLRNADLTRAELDGAVFSGARLENVKLLAYSISFGRKPINISMTSFGRDRRPGRPQIDERNPHSAEATYRALKRHFVEEGLYDSASWAAYCERLLQRKNLWRRRRYLRWVGSLLFGLVSGYGESPHRVVTAAALLILFYAALYSPLTWSTVSSTLHNMAAPLVVSAATFTGLTVRSVQQPSGVASELLMTSEAFLGLFMMGLFVFTLTKRYVAR